MCIYLYGHENHVGEFDTPWDWDSLTDDELDEVSRNPWQKWPNYFDELSVEQGRSVEEDLSEPGFDANLSAPYTAPTVYVEGWRKPVSWFDTGDLVHLWKWKTPLRVAEVKEPGTGVPVGVSISAGEEGRTLILEGVRGGRYIVHAPVQSDDWYFHQRATSDAEMFERTHVKLGLLTFVGNPERDRIRSTD